MVDEIRCVVPAGDICGEGAVWHPEQEALYWTDINRFLVHKYVPGKETTATWFFDEPVTSVNLTTDPEVLLLVLGARAGFWSPRTHPHVETIYQLAAAPRMRFNDARVDVRGSLWVGTMRNNVGSRGEAVEVRFSDGVLYRIDPDGSVTEWKTGIGISNTVTWAPDREIFYFGDTTANVIYSYAYDKSSGAISGEKAFFSGYERGSPDGSVTDAAGYLWNARYGGGCVVRIAPDGCVDRVVAVPAAAPTTCAFGGDGLKTLYITSARSDEQFSGSLFAIEPEVGGLPDNRFVLG